MASALPAISQPEWDSRLHALTKEKESNAALLGRFNAAYFDTRNAKIEAENKNLIWTQVHDRIKSAPMGYTVADYQSCNRVLQCASKLFSYDCCYTPEQLKICQTELSNAKLGLATAYEDLQKAGKTTTADAMSMDQREKWAKDKLEHIGRLLPRNRLS